MSAGQERVIEPELLDHASPEVARDNLDDLVRINRYLGGHAILRRIMADFACPQDCFSMLDVGAASGDMGAVLQRCYPRATITSLDRRCVHLEKAAHPKLAGDAFLLPFGARSFDFVFSSLLLHHFTDDQVVELFRNFRILARRAVIAIDLERGPLAYHFIPATRWLFGWHDISLYDGPVSVRAAFKKDELLALALRAGLDQARVSVHRPWARLSLVASVAQAPGLRTSQLR
ncbi:MAG TPA: methyltransferase domain-containing protein [Bryobacteraceae bacterium]|nr:methyltransferase domain-containing protein [Bryobacteraceae bacterium]